MYTQLDLHVPEKYHERIKAAITQDRPLAVKISLKGEPNATIWVTPGQMLKIKRSVAAGKNVLTLRMSRKQVKENIQHEGGFLSALLGLATKALPTILAGLSTGVLSGVVQKAITGNGLFLGKKGFGTARIDFEGEGMILTPVEDEKFNGLYLKHDGQIFRGEGILFGKNSPFKDIPILGLIL